MVETEALSLQLLGGFRICAGDAAVRIDQPRLQRLLVYLLLHRRHPRSRQEIAFTLWPDTNEEQALKNLRTLLTRLRQTQPELERFLDVGVYGLHWRPDAPYNLDVAGFEAACAAAAAAQRRETAAAIAAYGHAVQLYTGDLTPGWYDEWIVPERERLRQLYLDALEQLARLLEHAGRLRDALGYAQQLLRTDPLHEAAYRQLMQLHLALDDRASALRVYHTCATTLRNELGVDPSPATQALYLRLLTIDDEPAAQPQPAAAPAAANPTPGAAALVGRQAEWATLKQAWQSAAAGRAQLVLISGEAGIGKTRLAEELLAWVERQNAATAVARCYASGGSLAYAPLAEWLRSPGLLANVRQLDGIWRSEAARLLPELLTDRPDLPSPGPMTEAWQRQRFFQALGRAVLGADAGQVDAGHTAEAAGLAPPRLLLLDDGQWCDRDTLDWLHFLIQANANVPLLVLATVRVEEVGEDHPLTVLRLALARHDLVQTLHLAPLNAVATSALAAELLGHTLAPAEAARLFQDTEGNPLFVVETVRAEMADGETRRAAEGVSQTGSPGAVSPAVLPPKVRAVIRRRLALLSPGAQALAQTAAVIGREFTFAVLARASGQDEAAVMQSLDELWRRQLVREQGLDAYDFSHDKIRAVAYAEISPVRRCAMHLRVAEVIAMMYASDLDAQSIQIAEHYKQAGKPQLAISYFRRAAAVAQRIYANAEAARLYQYLLTGDLSVSLSAPETCALRLSLGEVWRVNGQWIQAEATIRAAMTMAETLNDVTLLAQAQRGLADVLRLQSHYDKALAWLATAEHGFEMSGDWRGVVSALWTMAEIYWFKGDNKQALATLERQLRIAGENGDLRGICEALDTMGMVYWSQGDWAESVDCCQRSIAIAEPLGYHVVITRAAITLGNVYSSQEQAGAALSWYLRAGVLARQIDDRQVLAWAITNSASQLHRRGDCLRALAGNEESVRIALEIGDRWTAWQIIFSIGDVARLLQATEQAEFLYRKAAVCGRRLDSPSYHAGMLVSLAWLLLEQCRVGEARLFYDEAVAVIARVAGERLGGEDTRFDAQVLGIRLRYVLGELSPIAAAAELRALLDKNSAQGRQAALHYELWRLAPEDAQARAAAAELYRTLYAETGLIEHRQRYHALTGETLPDQPPLPDVAELIPTAAADVDGLLDRLAPLLAQFEASFG